MSIIIDTPLTSPVIYLATPHHPTHLRRPTDTNLQHTTHLHRPTYSTLPTLHRHQLTAHYPPCTALPTPTYSTLPTCTALPTPTYSTLPTLCRHQPTAPYTPYTDTNIQYPTHPAPPYQHQPTAPYPPYTALPTPHHSLFHELRYSWLSLIEPKHWAC